MIDNVDILVISLIVIQADRVTRLLSSRRTTVMIRGSGDMRC